jgi:hypothetical protein
MSSDPVQGILDAIAALPEYPAGSEMIHLAQALADIAGTHPDTIRSEPPGSRLSRLYAFLYVLQNKLLAMTPDSFHPQRPASLVGHVVKRQTQRMAPAVAEFVKGHRRAKRIERKPDVAKIKEIETYRKTHTWDETDEYFHTELGSCKRRVLRSRKKSKNRR